ALRMHLPNCGERRAGPGRCTYGSQGMQAAISLSVVKQLRPAAKPFEVRDTRVKGFLLRVQPSGAMTYYVAYGRGKRIAIGRSDVVAVERARERAREVLAGVQFGEDPMEERRLAKAHTLRSF